MTRINVGIKPKELPDKLLLAEHREITRIPNTIKSGRAKIENIPPNFKLGSGHVKFFYNKLGYIHKRYKQLLDECVSRNFNVQNKESSFNEIKHNHSDLYNDYNPTESDRELIIERINSKGFKLL